MATYPDDRENPRDDNGFDRASSVPKTKSGNGILISMIVIGLLLVGGLTFALFYFLGGSGKIDNEMLAYLPADSTVLAGMEVEDLLKNAKIKDAINKLGNKAETDPFKVANEKLKPAGLTIDDFSRVLTGFTGDPDKEPPTVVIRTTKTFDKAKFAAAIEAGEEKKKGDTTYYAEKKGLVVYFPTDNLIVMTSEKHFEKLYAGKPTKIEVSEELQDLSKKMSRGQFWVAVSRKLIPDEAMNQIDEVKKGRVPYAPPELIDAIKDLKGAGFFINVDGDKVKFGGGILGGNKELFEKAESALKKQIEEQRAKKLDDDPLVGKEFAKAPEAIKTFVSDLQKSIAVDRNAALLEISASFTISGLEAMIEALIDQQKAQMEIQKAAFEKRMQQPEIDRKKFNIPPRPNFDDLKKSIERKPEDDLNFKVNPIPDPPKK